MYGVAIVDRMCRKESVPISARKRLQRYELAINTKLGLSNSSMKAHTSLKLPRLVFSPLMESTGG